MSGDGDHDRRHEDHEEHEGGGKSGTSTGGVVGLRLPSPLDAATEDVVHRTIGAAIEVHRQLGPGLLEAIYVDAMTIELVWRHLAVERERPVSLAYKGVPLRPYRIDLVVEGRLVVEAKAIGRLDRLHEAQLLSYLRATGIRVGLLLNFNAVRLSEGLRRLVV